MIEVLTPEVISELPLEKVIDNTLVKHNVTDAVINQLKEKYGELRLRDINDKESYLEVKEARKEVRGIGIITEKLCKKGREDAIRQQKLWLAKEKEILDKISKVQEPLDREIKKFDDEVERKEKEQQRLKEEAFMQRQSTLLRMGAVYTEGCFVLDDVSFEMPLIKESDNDIWEVTILSKYKAAYAKKEAALVEQDRIKKEQEEKLKKERAEFEEQQRLFKEQQAKFNREKEESEKRIREEYQRKEADEKQKRDAIIKQRCNQLQSLGMNYNFQYDAYTYEDVNVDNKTEISLLNDQEFDALVEKIKPVIEERKNAAEQKRLERVAKAQREIIEEEHRQAEIKKQQEEQKKHEELLKAGDKVKYDDIIRQLGAATLHEMRSPYYRTKVSIIREKIEEIKDL